MLIAPVHGNGGRSCRTITTEAAIRLGGDAEQIAPGPDWEGFRGIGNFLRRAYHRIDDQIIKDELPLMREAALNVH
jgi:hypothetical protein